MTTDFTLSFELPTSAKIVSAPQRPRSFSTGPHLSNGKVSSDVIKSKADDTRRTTVVAPSSSTNSSSNSQNQKQNPNRYKTELCRPFQEYGHCRYGDKCQFAHGHSDLRTPVRHPKYKTEFCRTFHSQGYCPYGARCHFIHSSIEARPPPATTRAPGGGSLGYLTFVKPPLSPSQDSGISSPEGTPSFFLGSKVFEYPMSDSSSSDDQDPEVIDALWRTNSEPWENTSNDGFSPVKSFALNPVEDITEKFSSTSLDEEAYPNSRSRLPVFNQLNSYSDTALDMASNWQ